MLDWVQMFARQWRPRGFVAVLCEGIYSVTDPPLRAVRGVIPPLRLGAVMLDLSPMILLFGIFILQRIVAARSSSDTPNLRWHDGAVRGVLWQE